jgi:hypothetical protein
MEFAEIEDLKNSKKLKDKEGKEVDVVISRTSELKLKDKNYWNYLEYKHYSLWFSHFL